LATSDLTPEQVAKIVAESEMDEAAVQAGVRDAFVVHKRLGNPIAVWQNEQVEWVAPEQIEIPEEPMGE